MKSLLDIKNIWTGGIGKSETQNSEILKSENYKFGNAKSRISEIINWKYIRLELTKVNVWKLKVRKLEGSKNETCKSKIRTLENVRICWKI